MNLLMIILIMMGLIVGACVFYAAWQLSSGEFEHKFQKAAVDEQRRDSLASGENELTDSSGLD